MEGARWMLLLTGIVTLIGRTFEACPDLTVTKMCVCNAASGEPYAFNLYCNSKTMANITETARSEGAAGNITLLSFTRPTDQVLRTGTFEGFTAVRELIITFSEVSYIEPRAFSPLSQLYALDLRNNMQLTWLSGDPFLGLSSLGKLVLERSPMKHLRDDLEAFFSAISDEILLDHLQLQCDCHILWLYDFAAAHSTVQNAECNGVDLLSLQRSSNFTECIDLCILGFHPCHDNATCRWEQLTDHVTCTCLEGFTGSGEECQPLSCQCPGEHRVCDAMAACLCKEGYTEGAGGECKLQTIQCIQLVNGSVQSVNIAGDVCTSQAVQDLQNELQTLPLTDPELSQFAEQLNTTAANLSLSGDIPQLVTIVQTLVTRLSDEQDIAPSFTFTSALIDVTSHLLDDGNQELWQTINMTDPVSEVVSLLSAMDELGILILTNTNYTSFSSDNIALVVVRPDCEDEDGLSSFSGQNISSDLLGKSPATGASNLSLPSSLFTDVFSNKTAASCSEVGVVSLVYGGVGALLPLDPEQLLASMGCSENGTLLEEEEEEVCPWYGGLEAVCPTGWLVNSVIISAVVVNSSEVVSGALTTPVLISLQHEDTSLSHPICSFFNELEPLDSHTSWLTNGCERDTKLSTSSTTICQCYHLTSFALLMSPSSSSSSNNRPLHIATKAGLSLSIFCLLLTILLLYTLKMENKMLHRVHRQLALALALAQLVFLVGVDRSAVPIPDQLCTACAVVLHYLLLTTFLWQLFEGVHLYLYLGQVFARFDKWERAYYFLAWGLPLFVVGPTLGLRFCDYGSENYCWITTGNGTNWAFHGPVIAVLVVNIIILVYVTFIIIRATRKKDDNACLLFTLLHASLVLVPILGVSWVLGFLVVGDGIYATVVEWFFFAFTTLQGVAIFFTHCVLNREVRMSFLKAIGCRELAKKQKSIMTHSKILSRVNSIATTSTTNLLKKISKRDKHSASDLDNSLTVGGFTNAGFLIEEGCNAYTLNNLSMIAEEQSLKSAASTPHISTPHTSTPHTLSNSTPHTLELPNSTPHTLPTDCTPSPTQIPPPTPSPSPLPHPS